MPALQLFGQRVRAYEKQTNIQINKQTNKQKNIGRDEIFHKSQYTVVVLFLNRLFSPFPSPLSSFYSSLIWHRPFLLAMTYAPF